MNPDLKLLVELQELDNIIGDFAGEIQSLPQKIAQVQGQLSEHLQRVQTAKDNLAANQRARRQREKQIAALRDKISRYRDQTLEVKTNEQYRALRHEIEFHEAEISNLEDAILAEMIESESLERGLRETEQSLAAEGSRAQEEITLLEKRKQENEERLSAARARRAEAQDRLSPDVYRRYERIAKLRKGLAVTEVLNGACGACHVRLRPQAYNDAKTNAEILTCESCDRILYYVPQPAAQ